MYDWDNLRFFLAVAEHGTVSGAAKSLNVSHSTVLRRIEQFESQLDIKLFRKMQKGYELMPEGELLFADARTLSSDVNRVLSKAEGHHQVTTGKLRISQPEPGIISCYSLYSQFQRENPEISLEIYSTMHSHNINQHEVDVVLRISDSPPDLLVGKCLGEIRPKVYASKNYLESLPQNHTIEDYRWVVWLGTYDDTFRAWFQSKGIEPNIALYAGSMQDAVEAVRNGMGVGFLSNIEAQKHGELVELFDGESIRFFKLWILTHRDLRNTHRVQKFMRFMSNSLFSR